MSHNRWFRDTFLEPELAEQLALIPPLPSHHRRAAAADQAQLTESPFGGHQALYRSIDPKPTCFLTRDAVAKATAPACTILHDPPITSRRDEPRHDAEM